MSYQKLALKNEIQDGKVKVIETKFVRVGITITNGELVAFEDVCTHDGAEIGSGKIKDGKIACPRHGAEFDLKNGKVLCMPATEDLKMFPVRVSGDAIEVDLED